MVVADHTKLGHSALHRMLGWDDISAIASDAQAASVMETWGTTWRLALDQQTEFAGVWRVLSS